MFTKTEAIVLSSTKYKESSYIINMFTEKHGKLQFHLSKGKTRESKNQISLLQPLSVVEINFNFLPKKEIHIINEFQLKIVFQSIPFSITKTSIALFIAEFLTKIIPQREQDSNLFYFLCKTINYLDESKESISNIHIYLLLHTTKYLGIEPQIKDVETNKLFDLRTGELKMFPPSHKDYLSILETQEVQKLKNETLEHIHLIKIKKDQRDSILNKLISYYKIHLGTRIKIKSIEVLKTVFHD